MFTSKDISKNQWFVYFFESFLRPNRLTGVVLKTFFVQLCFLKPGSPVFWKPANPPWEDAVFNFSFNPTPFEFSVGQAMLISALTHWGFFWANTSVIYIAEIYDNYECPGSIFWVWFQMLKGDLLVFWGIFFSERDAGSVGFLHLLFFHVFSLFHFHLSICPKSQGKPKRNKKTILWEESGVSLFQIVFFCFLVFIVFLEVFWCPKPQLSKNSKKTKKTKAHCETGSFLSNKKEHIFIWTEY